MKEGTKIQSIHHQRGHHVVFALLVKDKNANWISFSQEKTMCKKCKENIYVKQYIKELKLNKTVKILDMYLRLKKVFQFLRPIKSLSLKCIG